MSDNTNNSLMVIEPYSYKNEETVVLVQRSLDTGGIKLDFLTDKGLETVKKVFNVRYLMEQGLFIVPGTIHQSRTVITLWFRFANLDTYPAAVDFTYTEKYADVVRGKAWYVSLLYQHSIIKTKVLQPEHLLLLHKMMTLIVLLASTGFNITLGGHLNAIAFCTWYREIGFAEADKAEDLIYHEILNRACHSFVHNYHHIAGVKGGEEDTSNMIDEIKSMKLFGEWLDC